MRMKLKSEKNTFHLILIYNLLRAMHVFFAGNTKYNDNSIPQ